MTDGMQIKASDPGERKEVLGNKTTSEDVSPTVCCVEPNQDD
jgi:hypothetical protein